MHLNMIFGHLLLDNDTDGAERTAQRSLQRIHAEYQPTADLSFSACTRRVDGGLPKPSSTHGSTRASVACHRTRVVARHERCGSGTYSACVLHSQRNGVVNGPRDDLLHWRNGRRLGGCCSSSMPDSTSSLPPGTVRRQVGRLNSSLTGSCTESIRDSGRCKVNSTRKRILNRRLNGG